MFSIWTENYWKAAKYKDFSQIVVGRARSFGENWWECDEEKEELENASSSQAARGILLALGRWKFKG